MSQGPGVYGDFFRIPICGITRVRHHRVVPNQASIKLPQIICIIGACSESVKTSNGSCHDHHGAQTRSSSVTALVGCLSLNYGAVHKLLGCSQELSNYQDTCVKVTIGSPFSCPLVFGLNQMIIMEPKLIHHLSLF